MRKSSERPNICRAWFNQPSTTQINHHLHGINVLVNDTGERVVDVWTTNSNIISLRVLRSTLSIGSFSPSTE